MLKILTEYINFATQVLVMGGVLYGIVVSRGNRKAINQNVVATAAVVNNVAAVTARVEEVHAATNGLTKRLEEAARREGVATGTVAGIEKGVQQEADRQKT